MVLTMKAREKDEKLIEVPSIKKYSSVLLTPKEYRKGRKRWQKKYNT